MDKYIKRLLSVGMSLAIQNQDNVQIAALAAGGRKISIFVVLRRRDARTQFRQWPMRSKPNAKHDNAINNNLSSSKFVPRFSDEIRK